MTLCGVEISSATKAASDFTVVELRDKLKALGLSMSSSKNDLITRLMEADSSGEWRLELATETVEDTAYSETDNGASTGGPNAATSELAFLRREMKLTAREKQMMQREVEIARREIEILRDVQKLSIDSREQTSEKFVAKDVRCIAADKHDGSSRSIELFRWKQRYFCCVD